MRHDAHKQPDTEAWLELNESDRIDLGIDDRLGSRTALGTPWAVRLLGPKQRKDWCGATNGQ
jgi:hypothetical protein